MRFVVLVLIALLAACTVTGSDGKPVQLTAGNAPQLIFAQMQKGCSNLMTNKNAVDVAINATLAALKAAGGEAGALVTDAASIGCALLVSKAASG